MKIMQEEIFGPVCSIAMFQSEEDAIRVANSTSYGLAAAVHTTDLNTALRVSSALQAGTVWVYSLPQHKTDGRYILTFLGQHVSCPSPSVTVRWI